MGLDMYLTKKTYVGAHWEHRKVTGVVAIKVGEKDLPIKFNRISIIEEHVGYWRKANHIHRWFVEKVQGGEDDCREHNVSIEQLKLLLEDCKAVKSTIVSAPEKLPTQEGFFFGGTDYDEYYWEDIEDTIKIIEDIVKEEEENGTGADYYYQSSW